MENEDGLCMGEEEGQIHRVIERGEGREKGARNLPVGGLGICPNAIVEGS